MHFKQTVFVILQIFNKTKHRNMSVISLEIVTCLTVCPLSSHAMNHFTPVRILKIFFLKAHFRLVLRLELGLTYNLVTNTLLMIIRPSLL